jgi:hypothetical protein
MLQPRVAPVAAQFRVIVPPTTTDATVEVKDDMFGGETVTTTCLETTPETLAHSSLNVVVRVGVRFKDAEVDDTAMGASASACNLQPKSAPVTVQLIVVTFPATIVVGVAVNAERFGTGGTTIELERSAVTPPATQDNRKVMLAVMLR